MAEVFISYARDDRKLVEPIAERLKELGVDVWFDIRIESGEEFEDVIKAELSKAKAVIVCWTERAAASHWVRSEAKIAQKFKKYVPVILAECELPLALSEIHAEPLLSWDGAANNEIWLKVLGRIAKLLGREGVAKAAKAFASGDEGALYDFARSFPEEPAAAPIWSAWKERHEAEFDIGLQEARSAADARAAAMKAEAEGLEAQIEGTVSAFKSWLAEERRGTATDRRPDPLAIVRRFVPAAEKKLRDEVAGLAKEFREAKGKLEALLEEIGRLNKELAIRGEELNRSRKEAADLSVAASRANSLAKDLASVKAKAESLNVELEARKAEQEQLRTENATLSGNSVSEKSNSPMLMR